MNEIVNLDGVRIRLQAPDLDGDGQTGGIETVARNIDSAITNVIQPSELGDSLKELNKDEIDVSNSRMSGIDLRARLHHMEVASVLALDSLVSLGVLPTKCLAFTRQKKRLSVSLDGKGRTEIVDVVAGKRAQDIQMGGLGMMDRAKNFFGGGQK